MVNSLIKLPISYNYVGIFLTYACNYKCEWCINRHGQLKHTQMMSGRQWHDALMRLDTGDIPLTIGGGEPTLYPEFYDLVNSINKPMDLLTNGNWNTQAFMKRISPLKFKRDAPYASIRFSYHPGVTNLLTLIKKVSLMQSNGYSVGIWSITHPAFISDIVFAKKIAGLYKIDFRFKEYLGFYNNKLYGKYRYIEMTEGKNYPVLCKPSEMLIGPNGNVYKCHQHLYSNTNSYGNLQDELLNVPNDYVKCETTQPCSFCDIKLKFNRFQEEGHCSVTIKPEK